MTREELIKVRDAETWCEVQDEIDRLFAEHESEIIDDGWESIDDFIENGNWEFFVENTVDAELKKMHMDGDTENATIEELFDEAFAMPLEQIDDMIMDTFFSRDEVTA